MKKVTMTEEQELTRFQLLEVVLTNHKDEKLNSMVDIANRELDVLEDICNQQGVYDRYTMEDIILVSKELFLESMGLPVLNSRRQELIWE